MPARILQGLFVRPLARVTLKISRLVNWGCIGAASINFAAKTSVCHARRSGDISHTRTRRSLSISARKMARWNAVITQIDILLRQMPWEYSGWRNQYQRVTRLRGGEIFVSVSFVEWRWFSR